MNESYILIAIALIVVFALGMMVDRYLASKGSVTSATLDAAAAKFIALAAAHEASTKQAALDASQAAEKRQLLLKQTLEKVEGTLATPAP